MTIPVGFAQVNFVMGSNAGGSWEAECTLGIDTSNSSGLGPAILEDVLDAWQTNVVPALSSDLQFRGGKIKFGPDATGSIYEEVRLAVGGVGTPALPPNVAALVRKTSDIGGRRGRGRMFVPGIPEGSVDSNGGLSTGYRTTLGNAMEAFRLALVALTLPAVLLHDGPSAGGGAEPAPTPIVTMTVTGAVATQRRRLKR